MYKIKPTLIDSYRVYKLEIFEKSLADILKQIKGEYEPKKEMQFGTIVHKFFETLPTGRQTGQAGLPTGQSGLMPEELSQLVKISKSIPAGVNEVSILHTIEDITFDIRIDRICGNEIHEFKTGSRFHGVDFYDSTLQWKVYLLAANAVKMTYHIITYNSKRPFEFKYHKPFCFYPYASMQKEIIEYAYEFIDFCRLHNVENYIR